MKRMIYKFIIDRLEFILGYFFNCVLLILFFYLYTGKVVEIVYPLSLSVFVFTIIITVQWYKYYVFEKTIPSSVSNPFYNLITRNIEQKDLKRLINEIHSSYLLRIDTIHKENMKRNHFFSQWVHMMKTPISIIDIIVQKCAKNQMDTQTAIDQIGVENSKLLDGLEQILGIVRLGSFAKDFTPETVDLVSQVRTLINLKKNQFIHNNVFPKIQCNKESIYVISDRKWNDLLIEQIVSNAVKYSQAEETSKNIVFQIDQQKDHTVLTIRDQGMGIPSHDLDRIFEPFFTGTNGRKVKNATGIGLFVCSEIAEKLGHKLEVKSEHGIGTEVSISYLTKL